MSSAPQRYFTIRVVMEKDIFRGVVADVTQIGVINVLVTHETILEPVVYAMAKTITDNLDNLPQDESAIQKTEESLRTPAHRGRRGLRLRRCGFASGTFEGFSGRGLVKVIPWKSWFALTASSRSV